MLLITFVCPGLGILSSGILTVFWSKGRFLIVIVFVLGLGYLGFFYEPRTIDDMWRYMQYMSYIDTSSLKDFLRQIFVERFSVHGLDSFQWPGSGVLLYLTAKYGNYRILSAGALIVTYCSRLLTVQGNYLSAQRQNNLRYSLWMGAMLVTVLPYLVLSVFRWYLSISTLMIGLYFEIKHGFRLRTLCFYVLAITFHPAALIFTTFRLIPLFVSKNKNERVLMYTVTLIATAIGFIESNRIIYELTSLSTHFRAYIRSISTMQLIDNLINCAVLILILSAVIHLHKQYQYRSTLNYLIVLIVFDILMVTFDVFTRLVQYTIPASVIILSQISFSNESNEKLKVWELLIPVAVFLLGVLELIVISYQSIPPVSLAWKDILLTPIFNMQSWIWGVLH